ncbi:hypothetical protein [Streptomyces sp. NPDC002122]|uniref:hypothetical protein n=1 Tax=Streptomyces sp. NPDC002122 TaxID=3154407 RepID=UPI003330C6BA
MLEVVQPGDLIFTEGNASRPEHVALVIGDGLAGHAPRPGRVVEVAKLAGHGKILVIRRLVHRRVDRRPSPPHRR